MSSAPKGLVDPKEMVVRWQAAWPNALAAWSKYIRLRDARLCATTVDAAGEGLRGSFAMIRLNDQSIVVDLESVVRLGLEDFGVEILAHEIGHHVFAPGSISDQLRLLARIRHGLPTLERHAAMVANLYTDLLINDRLQRQSDLRMADIYRRLVAPIEGSPVSQVWNLYLRIYENLWQLDAGALGATRGDAGMEGDAWLGARLIRVYANDWLVGAGRFAMLVLHYLLEDSQNEQQDPIASLLDTADAASGGEPYGVLEIEEDEIEGQVHPSEDTRITGLDEPTAAQGHEGTPTDAPPRHQGKGQARQPFEYGEILRSAGLRMSDHDIAVRYYRERALPYLVSLPTRSLPEAPDPLAEGLETWEIGGPLDELDWLQTVLQSPRAIPGQTTMRRQYGTEEGMAVARVPVDLDIYVDSSGSMPNPQVLVSYLSLAGAIVSLSALRAGSAVQATLWSGKNQYLHTQGFVRNEQEILRVLTGYFGGGTCFPVHRLRETYPDKSTRRRPAHILMISDDGITTMFDQDERGNSGWNISARALAAGNAGGTMALNIPATWEQVNQGLLAQSYAHLRRARDEQGWEIHAISRMEDLLDFAHAFSRRHYA